MGRTCVLRTGGDALRILPLIKRDNALRLKPLDHRIGCFDWSHSSRIQNNVR